MSGGRSPQAVEHELGLGLFIEAVWRPRFREALDDPKRRQKMVAKLNHFRHLDLRFAEPVTRSQQTSAYLLGALAKLHAPARCHLVSDDSELDGLELPLREALEAIVDEDLTLGAFVSCIPGRLASFHDEEQGNRFILHRERA